MPEVAVQGIGSSLPLLRPPPPRSSLLLRHKNDILARCNMISTVHKSLPRRLAIACSTRLPLGPVLSSSKVSQGFHTGLNFSSSKGMRCKHLSSMCTLCGGDKGGISYATAMLPKRPRSLASPRAAYKDPYVRFDYPVMTEKPEWWWRTLSCLPYLMAIQLSDAGYYIQPFITNYEYLEDLVFYIPGAVKRLPNWFSMAYCFVALLTVVKNKKWPHFFRFHLVQAMLLEILLSVTWYASNLMPLINYGGMFGIYYWFAVAIAYISVLLVCIRYVLAGRYATIPLVSIAALVHTDERH